MAKDIAVSEQRRTMNQFFQMLKKDHKEIKGILEQLTETKAGAVTKREKLFHKLRVELIPHMKAEESTFYPPLLAKKVSREDAMEGVEEHHVSDMVWNELETMPKGEDQWGAKMTVFKELVEHHIKDEESKVFKSAGKALDRDEIQNIMMQFDQEKQKIEKSLK
jgi:hypothetical protein